MRRTPGEGRGRGRGGRERRQGSAGERGTRGREEGGEGGEGGEEGGEEGGGPVIMCDTRIVPRGLLSCTIPFYCSYVRMYVCMPYVFTIILFLLL